MEPAKTILEAYQAADPMPLSGGDPYFVNLTKARASPATVRLQQMVRNCAEGHFGAIAFSGHRGSGKSTELRQLQTELSDSCFTLYLDVIDFLDPYDVDYTDVFLLVSRALLDELNKQGVPLSRDLLNAVERWFVDVTEETEESVRLSAGIATQAQAGVEIPFITKLLARLTANIKAGSSTKVATRHQLDRYFSGLLSNANLLLSEAAAALKEAGKASQILVLIDNLDRMPPERSEELFFAHGSQLQGLNCHAVYTVSLDTFYSTKHLATVFPNRVMLPNVKLRQGKDDAEPNQAGLQALREIISKRWNLDAVFQSAALADEIIRLSGGSVRQVIRLMREAALSAQARELAQIDGEAIQEAAINLQQDFERALSPEDYPLLAFTASTHGIEKNAAYLRLLSNTAILEYNGKDIWHDVNPLVEPIDAYQDARKKPGAKHPARGRKRPR